MIFALFSYPFSIPALHLPVILFVAAGAGRGQTGRDGEASPALGQRIFSILLCIVLTGIGLGLSNKYREKIKATAAWSNAAILYHLRYFEQVALDYAQLYPLLKDRSEFLLEYGQALHQTGEYTQCHDILSQGALLSSDPLFYNLMGINYKEQKNHIAAEAYYRYAFDMVPNRLYPLYLLMKLYAETDQQDQAYEAAQKVINFTPKIDSPVVREMKREAKELLP